MVLFRVHYIKIWLHVCISQLFLLKYGMLRDASNISYSYWSQYVKKFWNFKFVINFQHIIIFYYSYYYCHFERHFCNTSNKIFPLLKKQKKKDIKKKEIIRLLYLLVSIFSLKSKKKLCLIKMIYHDYSVSEHKSLNLFCLYKSVKLLFLYVFLKKNIVNYIFVWLIFTFT